MTFTRITVRADQMGGVPWIRGLRIRVATVVGMVADGMSERDVLDADPDLESRGRPRSAAVRRRSGPRTRTPALGRWLKFLIDNALSPFVAERLRADGQMRLIVAGFVALLVALPPIWMIQRSTDRALR